MITIVLLNFFCIYNTSEINFVTRIFCHSVQFEGTAVETAHSFVMFWKISAMAVGWTVLLFSIGLEIYIAAFSNLRYNIKDPLLITRG